MTEHKLAAGDIAPAFSLLDATNKTVSLADFAGKKVIVYFYPKAMTPGCTTQACDFTAARDTFHSAGYTVIGISPDSPDELAEFRDNEHLDVILLSDPEKSVLKAYGAYGEKNTYGKISEGVIRSTFAVDEQGKVSHAWYSVKATGHVGRVLSQLGVA